MVILSSKGTLWLVTIGYGHLERWNDKRAIQTRWLNTEAIFRRDHNKISLLSWHRNQESSQNQWPEADILGLSYKRPNPSWRGMATSTPVDVLLAPLCEESISHRWFPSQIICNTEFWCVNLKNFSSEQTVDLRRHGPPVTSPWWAKLFYMKTDQSNDTFLNSFQW